MRRIRKSAPMDDVHRMALLTQRDREILTLLYRLQFLTTDQLATMFFSGSKEAFYSRMQVLNRRGFVRSLRRQVGQEGSAFWYLQEMGRVAAQALLELPREERQSRREQAESALFLAHTEMVNDLYVTLWEARFQRRILDFTWKSGWEGRIEYPSFVQGGVGRVIPDAVVRMSTEEGEQGYLVEVDRGTMGTKQLEEKMERYREAFLETGFRETIVFLTTERSKTEALESYRSRLPLIVLPPGTGLV